MLLNVCTIDECRMQPLMSKSLENRDTDDHNTEFRRFVNHAMEDYT